MRIVQSVSWAVVVLLGAQASVFAQPAPAAEPEPGIPITSDAVKKACVTCHAADAKGCLTRIFYRLTTPEGGQETAPAVHPRCRSLCYAERVVPTTAASVSWLTFGMTLSRFDSLPKWASSRRIRASRFSLELTC